VIGATWLGLALSVLAAPPIQAPPEVRVDSVPGSELTVYLLTFEPGELIWERFGHNALWIRDHRTGRDWAYDYGRFSFGRTVTDNLRFIGRFAVGDLNYSMGEGDVRAYLAAYERAGRAIWSQELDLPPAARAALRDFLEWNIRDENREYQYNYYLDNCSTRIRDALDRVIGGQLRAWADTVRTPWTYRDHTRRTTESGVALYTALMLGLGQPVDRPISAWQEMFLPISLRPFLDRITIEDPDGRRHPLVKEAKLLVASDRFLVPAEPARPTGRYLAVGSVVGLLLATLGRMASRSGRWRLAFGGAAVGWSFLAGLGGLVLAAIWGFTTHQFSYANENLLQLNLVSLALAAVLPAALWRGLRRRRLALGLAGLTAGLSIVGLVLKVLPSFYQDNFDAIALALPVHLGLLVGLWLTDQPV